MFLSTFSYAQHNWYLSSGVGMNFTNVTLSNYESPFVFDANPDILIDLKLAKQLNKHWQAGLAVETGNMRTKMWYKIEMYQDDRLVYNYAYYDEVRLVSPNVSPALFVNYQLNMGRGSYMYAGPQLGIITGGNDLGFSQAVLPMAGANAGMALALTKNTKLQLNNGWRIARFNHSKADGILETTGTNTYTIRRNSGVTLSYFTFTVGIVAAL
ncbi:MAG: hypothetical protein H6550_01265 [Chitinophagales bacterium]|nr:hypothetical protein [Chitinophagales bacterium]